MSASYHTGTQRLESVRVLSADSRCKFPCRLGHFSVDWH